MGVCRAVLAIKDHDLGPMGLEARERGEDGDGFTVEEGFTGGDAIQQYDVSVIRQFGEAGDGPESRSRRTQSPTPDHLMAPSTIIEWEPNCRDVTLGAKVTVPRGQRHAEVGPRRTRTSPISESGAGDTQVPARGLVVVTEAQDRLEGAAGGRPISLELANDPEIELGAEITGHGLGRGLDQRRRQSVHLPAEEQMAEVADESGTVPLSAIADVARDGLGACVIPEAELDGADPVLHHTAHSFGREVGVPRGLEQAQGDGVGGPDAQGVEQVFEPVGVAAFGPANELGHDDLRRLVVACGGGAYAIPKLRGQIFGALAAHDRANLRYLMRRGIMASGPRRRFQRSGRLSLCLACPFSDDLSCARELSI